MRILWITVSTDYNGEEPKGMLMIKRCGVYIVTYMSNRGRTVNCSTVQHQLKSVSVELWINIYSVSTFFGGRGNKGRRGKNGGSYRNAY